MNGRTRTATLTFSAISLRFSFKRRDTKSSCSWHLAISSFEVGGASTRFCACAMNLPAHVIVVISFEAEYTCTLHRTICKYHQCGRPATSAKPGFQSCSTFEFLDNHPKSDEPLKGEKNARVSSLSRLSGCRCQLSPAPRPHKTLIKLLYTSSFLNVS